MQAVVLALLAGAVSLALAAPASTSAASIEGRSPEARALLKLVEMISRGERPSVSDVVAAHEEYKRLYKLQSDLAGSKEASLSSEDSYKQISKVLSQRGVDTVAENLFSALSAHPARSELTTALRKSIESAIDEVVPERAAPRT